MKSGITPKSRGRPRIWWAAAWATVRVAEDHLARISLCTSATMPRGEYMLPFSRDYTIYLSILNSLSQSFPKLVSINFGEEIKTDIIFRLVDKFYSHYLAIITISKLVVSTFSRVILKKKLDRIFENVSFWKSWSAMLFDFVSGLSLERGSRDQSFFQKCPHKLSPCRPFFARHSQKRATNHLRYNLYKSLLFRCCNNLRD